MTNTPDKSGMKATERVANWLATPEGEVEEAPVDAIRELLGLVRSRPPADQVPDIVESISEVIYDYLDERFPEGALPGGKQLFADDHLDAEFKHEAGCDELAERILAALQAVPAASEVGWPEGAQSLPDEGF